MGKTKPFTDIGHQRFTKSVLLYPIPYRKIIRKFALFIVLKPVNFDLC